MSISTNPIKDIQFNGLHWIEASAGSGKTFTLSSLMTRVLLESHLPKEVVATTFTRAATAELKLRIRLRLVEAYRFLDSRRVFTIEQNLAYADEIESKDVLLAQLLRHFASKVSYACERARIVIEQLDQLFVGTLDSFSQKMIREFAFESGKIDHVEITDNSKKYTHQVVHDCLRSWINAQPQAIIDIMYACGKLSGVDSYIRLVEEALNFTSAEFKQPTLNEPKIAQICDLISTLKVDQLHALEAYYNPNGELIGHVSKTIFRSPAKFTSIFTESLPLLMDFKSAQDLGGYASKSFEEHRKAINSLLGCVASEKLFTAKMTADKKMEFYQHPFIQQLIEVIKSLESMVGELDSLESNLKYHLCMEAKQKLPEILSSKSETTFSQQIRTILDVLNSRNGDRFANAVHNRYPVIIVDEFQDTNQEQDNILARIWRDKSRVNSGCMIMVGDRKQAIYGFRGGDMLTFINAHSDVKKKQGHFYHLIYNHRTIPELVQAVDALFNQSPEFGEQVTYSPVMAGTRPHPKLMDHGYENPTPLRWLYLQKGYDQHQQVAYQIVELLHQGQKGLLCFNDGVNRAVIEDDIAVLAKGNDDLDKIQYELERLGVTVNRPSKRSVFEGGLAQDVGALLAAILNPSSEEKVRRVMVSNLMNISLSKLSDIEKQADGMSYYINEFHTARELWFNRGFLTAWNYIFDTFNIWLNLVNGNSKESERVVVNLRHITELLSQNSQKYNGPQSLLFWYMKQLSKPSEREWELERNLSNEAGVKLMTIHKSKGLEFKIVFLFKADSISRESNKALKYTIDHSVDPYTNESVGKRVIGIGSSENFSPVEMDQHNERIHAENRRQWYVALTRASHRIYAMMQDEKRESLGGVGYWKNAKDFNHQYSIEVPLIDSVRKYHTQQKIGLHVDAIDMPNRRFYPRKTTSFTGLHQYLNQGEAAEYLASIGESITCDESFFTPISFNKTHHISMIAKVFPKGTASGTAIHEVMDTIVFRDSENYGSTALRRIKNGHHSTYMEIMGKYQSALPELSADEVNANLELDLSAWIDSIVSMEINGGVALKELNQGHYQSEMPFTLSMADRIFSTHRVSQLFKKYGLNMPELNHSESARFMTGSIDLVYQVDGKFYVADYKSNYLGNSFLDYQPSALHLNMIQSSYYLQAALYLVALHRYLKSRLSIYDPNIHLGGSSYMYLRGISKELGTGVVNWNPPIELILELDEILGEMNKLTR